MNRLRDRLRPDTYASDETAGIAVVAVGALPDSYVHVSDRLLTRAQALARAYELHVLPALDLAAQNRLNSTQAQSLLDELAFIGTLVPSDTALQPLLVLLQDAAARCAGSRDLELIIEGP